MTDIFSCVTAADPPPNGGTNNNGTPQTPAAETPTGGSNGQKGGNQTPTAPTPKKPTTKAAKTKAAATNGPHKVAELKEKKEEAVEGFGEGGTDGWNWHGFYDYCGRVFT